MERRQLCQVKYSELFHIDGDTHPISVWHVIQTDGAKTLKEIDMPLEQRMIQIENQQGKKRHSLNWFTEVTAFEEMHRAYIQLLDMGCVAPTTTSSTQDILLGRMLNNSMESMKKEFCRIALTTRELEGQPNEEV